MAAMRIGEAITITSKQHGYFPKSFVWRGVRHAVQAVESCSTTMHKVWTGGTTYRHIFRVRTAEARYELSQDPKRDTWKLEKVFSSGQEKARTR